jgi:hypothetical protein
MPYIPAAAHAAAFAHDTLARDAVAAPTGMEAVASLQMVPFQVSIRGDEPTATQFVADVHATLASNVPRGKVVCKVHVHPSHVSAKLSSGANRPNC